MTVAAVERCLSLIEVLSNEAEPVELIDIAARVGLANSAAHRILATLMARGWVAQDPASQNYALSLRLSTLAFRNLDARVAPDIVAPVLNALAASTREYCRLAIVEAENLVWIARAQGATSGLRYDPDMGQDIVLHATANGKAWLSALSENEALRIVRARGLESRQQLGPRAVKSVGELRAHLAETRARGYATAVEEAEAGTVALAVPFFANAAARAPVTGTISIAGPLVRIGPERYAPLVRLLNAAALELAEIWPLRSRQRATDRTGPAAAPPDRLRDA